MKKKMNNNITLDITAVLARLKNVEIKYTNDISVIPYKKNIKNTKNAFE